jgi:hypothetical protein
VSPEMQRFLAALRPFQSRLRVLAIADALLVATAAAGIAVTIASLSAAPATTRLAVASVILAAVFAALLRALWRRCSPARTAARIESADRDAANVVITAEELAGGRGRPPHRAIERTLFDAATARIERLPIGLIAPLTARASFATLALLALIAYAVFVPQSHATRPLVDASVPQQTAAFDAGELRVVVTPPAYSKLPVSDLHNPTAIVVLEGSRLRLEVGASAGDAALVAADGTTTRFSRGDDRLILEIAATVSQPLLIRQDAGEGLSRLLHLRVQPDERPAVRIERPAKDLALPNATGEVPLQIDARDDVGLASLVLRYTKISGSGENFTFEEGEWPLSIARTADREWTGRATLPLARLGLQDGDTLVYRALARDGRPGADPSSSDTFLIEIGRLSGIAATGFALPDDRDRQGLSQQMLIIKTERLHAARSAMPADAFADQSRLLAMEQRMVKAEFVFMTGGEVADEVEEAERGHELAEGRLENAAQVELLNAIREMSRAEERLNGGDTARGLEFERAALKALQRAFDRRRYLLRTLPERTRIDASRRLTGELATARSSQATRPIASSDQTVDDARTVLRELGRARSDATDVALLASRVIVLDTADASLQTAALHLSSARDADTRKTAIAQAERAVIELMTRRLTPGGRDLVRREPLPGPISDELRRGGVR